MAVDGPACPKRMEFGPCGGVRPTGGCEMAEHPCAFLGPELPRWEQGAPLSTAPESTLLAAAASHPVVLTDLTVEPFSPTSISRITELIAPTCDAMLLGEHQNRPDFPPALLAALVREAGGIPWLTLTCRDRNRLVLEQDLEGLKAVGADGVLCVTGDGRAHGTRPGVTQVFDLDGPRLAALARSVGLAVAVPESPAAQPQHLRPARVALKERAGAHVCFLNHVSSAEELAAFVSAAREAGATVPFVAGVALYTDERSAAVLSAFPGLGLDPRAVRNVLDAPNPETAGIAAAVHEARSFLAVDGVAGVNISGLASTKGLEHAATLKATVGAELLRQGSTGTPVPA